MNRIVLGVVIVLTLLLVLTRDEEILTAMKLHSRFKNTVVIQSEGKTVWRGPTCNPFSRRSVFNPSMVYDAGQGRWYVFSRNTRGRRLLQWGWQQILENDVVRIQGREFRASIMLTTLDGNFNPMASEQIFVETKPRGVKPPEDCLFWQGEDPRVFMNEGGRMRIQATVHDGGIRKLGQGNLVRRGGLLTWNVQRIIQSPTHEKNWSALPKQHRQSGRQIFLSHVYPQWRMVTLDEGGRIDNILVSSSDYQPWFKMLRCTSGCQPFLPGRLLTCLHTVHPYRTVLCEIDEETLLPTRISQPLEFDHPDSYIEFCSGLTVLEGQVYFGIGLNDTHCEIRKFSIAFVNSLLTIQTPSP